MAGFEEEWRQGAASGVAVALCEGFLASRRAMVRPRLLRLSKLH
jgi:hypothetical protein